VRGTGLVEVVVATWVLSLGLLAVLGLQLRSLEVRTLEGQRDRARLQVRALADSIDRGLLGPTGTRGAPWGRMEWAPAAVGVVIRAVRSGADSVQLIELWTGAGGATPQGGL
jgi:hypothetical protein